MIQLDFEKMGGLIPAIVQEHQTDEVLMLGFMDQAAWEATLSTGQATFYSRTRKKIWVKGKTSGNLQIVKEIRIDCDNDSVLLKIDQIGGAACHTGYRSCFYKGVRGEMVENMGEPHFDPAEVYGQ